MPFPETKKEQQTSGDPRPSLEERYGTAEGYRCLVRDLAEQQVKDRLLLPDDAARLVNLVSKVDFLPVDKADDTAKAKSLQLCHP